MYQINKIDVGGSVRFMCSSLCTFFNIIFYHSKHAHDQDSLRNVHMVALCIHPRDFVIPRQVGPKFFCDGVLDTK